jgi:CheY-like chemotaxis protein
MQPARKNMRTRKSLSSLNLPELNRHPRPVSACGSSARLETVNRAILLISNDAAVGERLRQAADQTGHSVVQAAALEGAFKAVRSEQLAAAVLDLDLPSHRAWKIADDLLQEAGCPPLVLLTGSIAQFDMRTAMQAGSLVDKSASPARLAEAVNQAIGLSPSNLLERNAIQRVVIQWLRPCGWSAPVTPAYRFWGLNE